MTNKIKKCPHCGSISTLPIVYGHMPHETHQKNTIKKEWVWGGCKLGAIGTGYCNDCGKNFGEVTQYNSGPGVITVLFSLYQEDAEQGNADAQYNLGVMYAEGHGVSKDLSKAKYWINKSCENLDASADTLEEAKKSWNGLELGKY